MNDHGSTRNDDRTALDGRSQVTAEPEATTTTTVIESPDAITGISWRRVYECPSPTAFRARHRERPEERGWIALDRTFTERLESAPVFEPDFAPEIGSLPLFDAMVFLLAATRTDPPGRIGHVAARTAARFSGRATVRMTGAPLHAGEQVVERVVDRLLEIHRVLAPEAAAPEFEIAIPREGVGDSHALAAGIACVLALFGCRCRASTAATGGYDPVTGRFRPVPAATLGAKLAAASRWGLRRIMVVEGQAFDGINDLLPVSGHGGPPGSPASPGSWVWRGIELRALPADPAALPIRVVEEIAQAPRVDVLRQALGLYDRHVARNLGTTLEAVHEATAAFLPARFDVEVARRCDGGGERDGIGEGSNQDEGIDSILALMAADIRSRKNLHAGRSEEASAWFEIAKRFRGRDDLPDGVLGDHLLYEQAAHRAVIAIDQGVLEDDGTGTGPHAVLEDRLTDLDRRWCTTNQSMQRIFLANTRARQRLYLGRLELDVGRCEAALADCLAHESRWASLLETYAGRRLRLGNTNLRRQENFWIEHLVTFAMLQDPRGFDRLAWRPDRRPLEGLLQARTPWMERNEGEAADDSAHADPGAYDLLALLQWHWLAAGGATPDQLRAAAGRLLELAAAARTGEPPHPLPAIAGWLLRLDADGVLDRPALHRILIEAVRAHVIPAVGSPDPGAGSIQRVLAHRSARILDLEGVSNGAGGGWAETVSTVLRPASLERYLHRIIEDPELVLARCPY